MLDVFEVLTHGGIVLYQYKAPLRELQGDPVNALIQRVFIENPTGAQQTFSYGKYNVQYKRNNERGLLFVAVYAKPIEEDAGYVGPLLSLVHDAFLKAHADDVANNRYDLSGFESTFQALYRTSEQEFAAEKQKEHEPRRFENTKKFANTLEGSNMAMKDILRRDHVRDEEPKAANGHGEEEEGGGEEEEADGAEEEEAEDGHGGQANGSSGLSAEAKAKLKKLAKIGKRPGPSTRTSKSPAASPSRPKPRQSQEAAKPLDYSAPASVSAKSEQQDDLDEDMRARYRQKARELGTGQLPGVVDSSADKLAADGKSGLFSFFTSLTGSSVVNRETLRPVLDKMREHLIGKNVAADIAEKLCASMADRLEGTTKSTFQTLSALVRSSLEQALTQILSPRRHIDILRDIHSAQRQQRPFTVVFCGVNGVGKSTNLAKIAFWLLSNKLRVLIAACDTFRAGAVEQLKTHVRKLRQLLEQPEGAPPIISLYDKGYGKDDAGVAADAIRFATEEKYDVVLVDTAGRMQDNEPLMRSLAKLIRTNEPDLVLFVGEALVGNEAVDQLTKFNQALMDNSDRDRPRTIDGIVLTKFDTVDDKVGSSISMTYTTGQPIVFVGTGQNYDDLKKLNVESVVSMLLK